MNYAKIVLPRSHDLYGICHRLAMWNTDLEDERLVLDEKTYLTVSDLSQDELRAVTDFAGEQGFSCCQASHDETNTTVEYMHCKSVDQETKSIFTVHLESDGDFIDPVTICCYVMNETDGGGLNIYDGVDEDTLHTTVNTKCDDGMVCVIFDEHTYHLPQSFTNGERKLVSFHIRKNA